MTKGKAMKGAILLLVVAGVFAVAIPAFAASRSTMSEAANVLGISVEEIYAAKVEGKTLAELALSKGITVEELTAKIVTARLAELDALVAEGTITSERAEVAKANIEANVARAINQQCTGTCNGTPGTGACGMGRGGQRGRGNGAGIGAGMGMGLGRARAGR